MTEILAAVTVFAVALTAMAVGVIFSNRAIQGSCGGIANLRDEHGEVMCPVCGDPRESCGGEEDGRRRDEAPATAGPSDAVDAVETAETEAPASGSR